jgi:MFS family permease
MRTHMRNDLRLLRNRRFALLFSARTVSVLGSAITPVALAFAVLGLPGATPGDLGLVLGAETVSLVVFLLLGGVVADRLPRYWVMVVADVVAAVNGAAMAAVFLTGTARLPLVMVLAAIQGMASAMFFPAMTGIVPQVVLGEQLQVANGLLRLAMNSAQIAGLALAGGLVTLIGPGWALLADAATFAISALFLSGLRVPHKHHRDRTSMFADLREGWREFVSRQWVWVVVAQFAVINMAFAAGMGVLGPVFALRELHGAAGWSMVLAAEAVGMVFGVLIALRLRPSRPILTGVLATFVAAVPFLLLGFSAPLIAVMVASLLTGIAFDVFTVLWDTALQKHVPSEALSRVSSYDALGSLALNPLGMVLAGPLAGLFGLRTALLGCAVLIIVPTALALLSPEVRQLTADATSAQLPTGA